MTTGSGVKNPDAKPPVRHSVKTNHILIAAAVLACAAILYQVVQINASLGGEIAPFGWFAYAAGGLVSLAVAGGLFFLLFYSARRGYDDIDRGDDGFGPDD